MRPSGVNFGQCSEGKSSRKDAAAREDSGAAGTGVPIPKFASLCGTFVANFGIAGHQQLIDLVWLWLRNPHDALAVMRICESPPRPAAPCVAALQTARHHGNAPTQRWIDHFCGRER